MKAFTLIELLVVVTIILVLLAITLVNFKAGDRNFSLEESAVILAQDLRRTEEMSMSAKQFKGIIPPGGYGVSLQKESDSYIIFADCNKDYSYSLGNFCNGSPEKIEQVYLGKRSQVASLFVGSYLSVLDIVFTPPYPTVSFSGSGTEAIIKLSLKEDVSSVRTVRVNKAGLIESF